MMPLAPRGISTPTTPSSPRPAHSPPSETPGTSPRGRRRSLLSSGRPRTRPPVSPRKNLRVEDGTLSRFSAPYDCCRWMANSAGRPLRVGILLHSGARKPGSLLYPQLAVALRSRKVLLWQGTDSNHPVLYCLELSFCCSSFDRVFLLCFLLTFTADAAFQQLQLRPSGTGNRCSSSDQPWLGYLRRRNLLQDSPLVLDDLAAAQAVGPRCHHRSLDAFCRRHRSRTTARLRGDHQHHQRGAGVRPRSRQPRRGPHRILQQILRHLRGEPRP